MQLTKKYFQDKGVLLLLGINVFLAFLTATIIVLRLGSSNNSGYLVQYRANVSIGEFKSGGIVNFIYFIIFAILVAGFNIVLSYKTYTIRRQFAVTVLGMSILLLSVAIIVSNALLVLR